VRFWKRKKKVPVLKIGDEIRVNGLTLVMTEITYSSSYPARAQFVGVEALMVDRMVDRVVDRVVSGKS
jgi:hypothetical protein